MWPSIPSGNVAPVFYLLLYALSATKTYDSGQNVRFYHNTKPKAVDKTLKERLLKKLKAMC